LRHRLTPRLLLRAVASAAILAVDFRDCDARLKADQSPISRADEAAHTAIAEGLARSAPGIPVISEEAVSDWHGRTPPHEFLLVDPLDGTREFLAGRLEYTVNIALVRGGTPVVLEYDMPRSEVQRRLAEIESIGGTANFTEILADIVRRDERDMGRADSPLKPAADAHLLDTSEMAIEAAFLAAMAVIDDVLARRNKA
jgi:hypothetical protein